MIANQGGTLDLFRGPTGGRRAGDLLGRRAAGGAEAGCDADRRRRGRPVLLRRDLRLRVREDPPALALLLGGPLLAGGGRRARSATSGKVGFCMFDSFGPAQWFGPFGARGRGGDLVRAPTTRAPRRCGWGCPRAAPTSTPPSSSASGSTSPGSTRGRVVVRGEANPLHCVLESNSANNDDEGDARDPRGAGGGCVGRLVGASSPASWSRRRCRRGGPAAACPGRARSRATSGPRRPARCGSRVAREPLHGTVALAPGADGLHAAATYTPAAGYSGPDSFQYVATDLRGLTSRPATAYVTAHLSLTRCRCAGAAALEGAGRPPTAAAGCCRCAVSASGRISGRIERRRGKWRAVRRLRSRILDRGRTGSGSAQCSRGRYRLKLLVNGRVAARVRFRAALLDWKAAWLPSDTSTWAASRSAGAPRSSSRR